MVRIHQRLPIELELALHIKGVLSTAATLQRPVRCRLRYVFHGVEQQTTHPH